MFPHIVIVAATRRQLRSFLSARSAPSVRAAIYAVFGIARDDEVSFRALVTSWANAMTSISANYA